MAIDLEITIRRKQQRRVVDVRQANECGIPQRSGTWLLSHETCAYRANLPPGAR